MAWFVGFYGLWGLVTLAIFIRAIVISYRIEQMRGVKSRWGLPQYTNLLASAFGGSRSEPQDLQRLRQTLRRLLATVLAAMLVPAGIAVMASERFGM
ncbi:MAG: hypothetical protein R3D29_16835 [Nitratireductor sp.]